MDTNTKPKSTANSPASQVRDLTEKGVERSKQAVETIGAATTEVADIMKNCCSTALKGMQDYNSKLVEFGQANTKSYVEFVQRLSGVKSPSEFFEVATSHGRIQLETMAGQARELAELGQKVTIAATEPVQKGFAKSFNQAA
jgi:phasin